jgi:hypothetical protein
VPRGQRGGIQRAQWGCRAGLHAHGVMLMAADAIQLVFDAMPALIACSVALCWAAAGCC